MRYMDEKEQWDRSRSTANSERYRGMAGASNATAAPSVASDRFSRAMTDAEGSLSWANEPRGKQVDATQMSYANAAGGPSQASTLGQQTLRDGVAASYAGASSVRGGPLAQASALRSAQMGQASMMQEGNQQIAAARANEQAQARQRYADQTAALREGDFAGQKAAGDVAGVYAKNSQVQADLDARQRGLNQQNELFYEGKNYDTNANQLQNEQRFLDTNERMRQQRRLQKEQNNKNVADTIGGFAKGVGSLLAFSDDAAKRAAFLAGADYALNDQRLKTRQDGTPKSRLVTTSATGIDPRSKGTKVEGDARHIPTEDRKPGPIERGGSITARGEDMTPPLQGLPKDPITGERIFLPPKKAPKPLPAGIDPKKARGELSDATDNKPRPDPTLQQDANRRGAGFTYAYKDGFESPGQAPGELNYGPSANELERNPLTATAIKRDPATGLRQVDVQGLVKNNTAGIASLQDQLDELKGGRYG